MTEKPTFTTVDKLAFERTCLAYERTMMAWIRTAISLITFGFSVYKFFEIEHASVGRAPGEHLIGSREFGLLLISFGLVSLLLAAWQNRTSLKALREQYPNIGRSPAQVLAVLVGVLGIAAWLAALLRK